MRSTVLSLILLGAPLAAQTTNPFADLTQATRASFPDKVHYGVICDYTFSRAEVQKLADAMGSGHLTVVDIRTRDQVAAAAQLLNRTGTELLVLLPKDRLLHDGAPHATLAVWQMGAVPVVGTQARALENGAAFAIGEGTGHELLVNKNLRGIIGPVTASSKSAWLGGGSAQISVVRAK